MTTSRQSSSQFVVDDSVSRGKTTIVTARDLTIAQGDPGGVYWSVNPSRDLEIYANHLTISGPISLPGRSVTIFARTLHVPAGLPSAISVSVGKSTVDPETIVIVPLEAPAAGSVKGDPTKPWLFSFPVSASGSTGSSGVCGARGGDAGSISIRIGGLHLESPLLLSAVGGQGGKGQTGQTGGKGGRGRDGMKGKELWDQLVAWEIIPAFWNRDHRWPYVDRMIATRFSPAPILQVLLSGYTGGNGGSGGRGGDGGPGGKGGKVEVVFAEALDATNSGLTIDVAGGAKGEPGAGGAPGPPGDGGSSYECDTDEDKGDPPHGPSGGWGPRGSGIDPATTPPPASAGTAVMNKSPVPYGDLFKYADVSGYWSMLLERSRDLYLSAHPRFNPGGFANTAHALNWISDVLRPNVGALASRAPLFQTTLDQATTLLSRLRPDAASHLDVFGHDFNYVPLPSFAFYTGVLDTLLPAYKELEEASDAIFSNLNDRAQLRDHLTVIRDGATATINWKNQQLKDAWDQLDHVTAAIQAADLLIPAKRVALLGDLKGLEQAVTEWARCTAIGAVVKGFETCAFVPPIAEGGVAPAGIAMAGVQGIDVMLANFTSSSGLQIEKRNLIGRIENVEGTIASLQEGYAQVNGLITENDPNGAKLLGTANQLDRLLQDLATKVPGVSACREALDDFVGAVQARNQQILSYNQLVARMMQLHLDIKDAQAHVAVVNSEIGGTVDPALSDLAAATSRISQGVRERVLFMFYMASRAYSFLTFQDDDSLFNAVGLSNPVEIRYSPTLSGARAYLATNFAGAVQEAGGDLTSFPASGLSSPVRIRIDDPGKLADFKLTGSLRFEISATSKVGPPLLLGWRKVRVSLARPWVEGLRPRNQDPKKGPETVTAWIFREGAWGDRFLIDEAGHQKSFVYDRTGVPFTYLTGGAFMDPATMVSDAVITGKDQNSTYALVGPFGAWHIKVDQEAFDLTGVTGVTLELFGQHR